MREAKAAKRASQAAEGTLAKRRRRFCDENRLLSAAYGHGGSLMQPHFARQVRLYVAAAFLDTQLAFLRSLVHRASEQRLLLLVTRFAWDETSQRLTASTGELAAEQTQGAFSVMIPALQLTLVWARERKHGESDGEPEALTCKLVLPPVILAGGSAERVWDGLFGHADLQSIWSLHEQLVKAAEHVATIVETDAASVNDKVFAGRRWLALIANSKDLCDTCVCVSHVCVSDEPVGAWWSCQSCVRRSETRVKLSCCTVSCRL